LQPRDSVDNWRVKYAPSEAESDQANLHGSHT
jgi:hypothetical protein